MDAGRGLQQYRRMIHARVEIDDPLGGPKPLILTVVPHPSYGSATQIVHEMLILGLTAEWPCLLTADEELVLIPPGSLHSLRTCGSTSAER